jgi:hypothetical protein
MEHIEKPERNSQDRVPTFYVSYLCLSEDKRSINVQTYVVDQARSKTIKVFIDLYHLLQWISVFGPHILGQSLWRHVFTFLKFQILKEG